MHGFDYNLDHLGLGTLDRPDWKIHDRATAYATRAAAARGGLWGNHGYEATYAMAWTDAGGEPLDGTHNRYELRLSPPPPVDAFWSLTIYIQRDAPDTSRRSNWLPTPDGRFRPLMRMYQPRLQILEGDYVLPAITKVE